MAPNAGGAPSGKVADAITASFGSFDEFSKQFKAAGATQFGSGWAWLVTDKAGKLSVTKSPNAETPIVTAMVCTVSCCVFSLSSHEFKAKLPGVTPERLC
jgi:superoxide dismutase, Fe-Mn family